MNKNSAIKLARYHKFQKSELNEMMVEALNTESEDYWKQPNHVNRIFDNGAYFNLCRKWLDYTEQSKEDYPVEVVVVRILEGFGEYAKVRIPKKKKIDVEIKCSEKPKL